MAAQTPTLAPKGALLMGILTEGRTPDLKATPAQLAAWSMSAMAPYTLTLDSVAPQPPMEDAFGLARDSYILIDLKTMKITDIVEQDIDAALAKLTAALGP